MNRTNPSEELPYGLLESLLEVAPKYNDYVGRSPARGFSDSPKKRKAKKKKRKAAKKARRQNRR